MHIPFLLQGAQANPSMTTPSPSGTSSTPSALSAHTIATGNMPIALSTLGTAGQYNAQFAGLPLASSNVGIGTAATLSSPAQYTNTNQTSSSRVTPIIKHLFKLLIYKLFAFFSNLCFLSIYKVVSYE